MIKLINTSVITINVLYFKVKKDPSVNFIMPNYSKGQFIEEAIFNSSHSCNM